MTARKLSADAKRIGARFLAVRRKRGLSRRSLSAAAGVTMTTIACLERGERLPSLYTVIVLCNALRADIAELLPEEEET